METVTPAPGVQRLIDLVRRRDVLMAERVKITANIDAEIARIDNELAVASATIVEPATPAAARQRSMNLRVRPGSNAEKVLLALTENPKATPNDLALAVYGEVSDSTRHKVRAIIFHLRNTNRLSRTALAVKPEGAP